MELTEEEIKELKDQAKVETDLTKSTPIDIAVYDTVQDLMNKVVEVMSIYKDLTLEDFTLDADVFWIGEESYGELLCSYEIPLTQDEMFDILKRNLINKKQREFEAYKQALEVVKEYEENNK